MTGPRIPFVHPHRYRGARYLLPFAAAIFLGPLACSSDQSTEPSSIQSGPSMATAVRHPRPKTAGARISAGMATHSATPKPLMSFSSAEVTGASVLILADTDVVSTTALATSLADAGLQVTLRPAPEWTWDGTNPSLSGFDVVVHLNGATFDVPLPAAGQTALTNFVQNGGGFVGGRWDGYEVQPGLADLVLSSAAQTADPDGPERNCAACQVTYETLPAGQDHPVLAGLPASFTFLADAHDAGPQFDFASDPSTVLMQVQQGGPGLLVRQFGAGRVVHFSFAANYQFDDFGVHDPVTLQDPNVQLLYANAVNWAAGSGSGTAQPQTITFDPLAGKVYGDAAFSISASASSGLPVTLTATGPCTVLGTTVTITGTGTCTITAQQAGNDNYLPAADVSQSFNIVKAPATITIGTEYTFDGTAKSATAITSPAGLGVVTLTYSQNGSPVAQPINAGTYQVLGTLDNPNYEAPPATGTLTILQATPAIQWTPASITAGAPLGAAQLNATALGVGGASLSGGFEYTPPAGTTFTAGTAQLAVQFTPDSPNYTGASKSVTIKVLSGLTFSGFFAPVRNLPAVNVATAGSTIPMKFTVGGFAGMQIFSAVASPSSVEVQCGSNASENSIRMGTLSRSGLQSRGYSYSYNWKTNPAWAGTCRKFVLTLSDGSTHEALFRFPSKVPAGAAVRRIIGGR
jgi:hypothetical protein